jgi:hypothetical protein
LSRQLSSLRPGTEEDRNLAKYFSSLYTFPTMANAPNVAKSTLQALYKANRGILRQKLDLMDVMRQELGHKAAKDQYQTVCNIVHASMGQHVRHSMDHIELAANMAVQCTQGDPMVREIHYDLRERGGTDESDMDAAEDRIKRVEQLFQDQANRQDDGLGQPVDAFFMLSGDPMEFKLASTVHRELGFAVHHAIHHMAMVKIIAVHTLQLQPDLLPLDFGKAPSTIVHDNQTTRGVRT